MRSSPYAFTPDEIQARAHGIGISMYRACRNAGVSESTFYHWRAGRQDTIKLATYVALCEATAGDNRR